MVRYFVSSLAISVLALAAGADVVVAWIVGSVLAAFCADWTAETESEWQERMEAKNTNRRVGTGR